MYVRVVFLWILLLALVCRGTKLEREARERRIGSLVGCHQSCQPGAAILISCVLLPFIFLCKNPSSIEQTCICVCVCPTKSFRLLI